MEETVLDICGKCGAEVGTEDEPRYYIEEEDLYLCEECYVSYLAQKKKLC